jgi:hypothetical protein
MRKFDEELLTEFAEFFKLFSIAKKKPKAVKNYAVILKDGDGLLYEKDYSMKSGYIKEPILERHPLPEKIAELMKSENFSAMITQLATPRHRSDTGKHGFKIVAAKWRKTHELGTDPEKRIKWELALEALSYKYYRVVSVIAQIIFFGGVFAGFALLFWHLFY